MTLAHGVGVSADLPLPLDLVLQAGAATVVLSFLIAAFWWRRPRLGAGRRAELPLRRLRWPVLLLTLYLTGGAFLGPPGAANPVAHALFIWLWVGLVPVSVVLGPVWRQVNPLRTLFALLRLPRRGVRPLPPGRGAGAWPAAGFLLAFVWFELVAPRHGDPVPVGVWLIGYATTQLACAVVRGEEWFARGDCFEVYSELAGRLSPLVWRPWLSGAAAPLPGPVAPVVPSPGPVVPSPRPVPPPRGRFGPAARLPGAGIAAFVAVWWGSTVFDSASASPAWAGFVQRAGHGELYATAALVLVCGLVLVAVERVAGRLDVTASLVPIAVGYTLAHYLSLLLVEGPRGLVLLLRLDMTRELVPIPGVIAAAQIALILAGHVLGVIVAHDRALAESPGRPAPAVLADELPMVIFMIGCTWAGLFLLFVR